MTAPGRLSFGRAACAAALFCLSGLVLADPYPVEQRIDVEHYRFAVTLSDTSDSIDVVADITVRILDPRLKFIELDLIQQAPARDGRGMQVSDVLADGEPTPFRHRYDRLRIDVPRAAAQSGRITVQVRYSGTPWVMQQVQGAGVVDQLP